MFNLFRKQSTTSKATVHGCLLPITTITHIFQSFVCFRRPGATAASEKTEATADTIPDELLFPSWPPPSPRAILARREAYRDELGLRRYRAPEGVFEDSPLFALYRLYEWLLADHTVNLRNELELFWWARWPVASVPDPRAGDDDDDDDPERYAVLACIPALLAESFNERIRLGLRREEPHSVLALDEQLRWAATPERYETVPAWAEAAPPLRELLHIPHSQPFVDQLTSLDDPRADPHFKEKNILTIKPHIHFI